MKFLKSKFSIYILFTVGLSVFMLSCEQEIIQSQDDSQVLVEKMVNDVDVTNFIVANSEFTHALTTKIKANKEEFEFYLSENRYDDIDVLLNISEINPLLEDMMIKKDIALNKYPDLIHLYDRISAKYYLDNSVITERCYSDGFMACMHDCGWTQSCYYHCYWWYCDSFWF